MPNLPPNSTDSPVPSPTSSPVDVVRPTLAWRTNLALFAATVASVFLTGLLTERSSVAAREAADGFLAAMVASVTQHDALVYAAQFTSALLTILVAHEFGHFIAARVHRVDASLPFFIPMPLLSPFGTMGAVIRMRGTIPHRNALLDIGASGPLAGLVFAFPMYLWGVAHSRIVPDEGGPGSLGESLAIQLLDKLGGPHVPPGSTIELSAVAFAAWAGMFVTMINLLPVGQLDGGHVAYALFGPRQNRIAQVVHRSLLVFFFVSLAAFVVRDLRVGFGWVRLGKHIGNSMFWLVWFEILAVLGTVSKTSAPDPAQTLGVRPRILAVLGLLVVASVGIDHPRTFLWVAWFSGLGFLLAMEARGGVLRPHTLLDHPPTATAPLSPVRRVVALVTLALFALLFMPTPISM
jgi:membrane-associated protease RseP (regulator of RpoE activity)